MPASLPLSDYCAGMSRRTEPPFRADHVGSLLRPPELLAARAAHAAGQIDVSALRAVEDEAIRAAVAMQERVGLQAATDGEFRRTSWHMDFIHRLGGIEKTDERIEVRMHGAAGDTAFTAAGIAVRSRVRLDEPIFATDFVFLQQAVTTALPKLTVPSPSMVHYRGGTAAIDKSVYPDVEQFWADLSDAYADEVRALGDLGCRYLQLDDTSLAYVNDPRQREHIAEIGGDPEHQHEAYIANINRAIADRPAEVTVTTHMCRGNNQSMWAASGSYDFVADALFNQLEVDGFFMEWDDERSGGFEPLRYVPEGKTVVLGLVTTKRPELESKDDLKRRIEEASRYVDVDQLCLSPQCGFSSTREGNDLTTDEQFRKLELVLETAAEVWGE